MNNNSFAPYLLNETEERKLGRDYLWRPVLELLDEGVVQNVLSVGGGKSSEWLDLLERYGLRLHVVDEYEGHGSVVINIDALQEQMTEWKLANQVIVTKADALEYAFEENKYDLVYARNSLHHIVPYALGSQTILTDLFTRLHTSLRPGGCFYIREIGRLNFPQKLRPFVPQGLRPILSTGSKHGSKTNLKEYIAALRDSGFRILQVQYYVPYRLRVFRLFLGNALANPFLTSAFMVLAQRE